MDKVQKERYSVLLSLSNGVVQHESEIVILENYTPCTIFQVSQFLKKFLKDWHHFFKESQEVDNNFIGKRCHDQWEKKVYSENFLCVRFAWSSLMKSWKSQCLYQNIQINEKDICQLIKESQELSSQLKQFCYFKIKVGRKDLEEEIQFIQSIVKLRPEVKLILDANALLSFEQADQLLSNISIPHILYIEDITKKTNEWNKLKEKYKVSIASDEFFRLKGSLLEWEQEIRKEKGIDYIVCKPSQWGAEESLSKAIRLCQKYKIKLILSSCYEGKVAGEGLKRIYSSLHKEIYPILGYSTIQQEESWNEIKKLKEIKFKNFIPYNSKKLK